MASSPFKRAAYQVAINLGAGGVMFTKVNTGIYYDEHACGSRRAGVLIELLAALSSPRRLS